MLSLVRSISLLGAAGTPELANMPTRVKSYSDPGFFSCILLILIENIVLRKISCNDIAWSNGYSVLQLQSIFNICISSNKNCFS